MARSELKTINNATKRLQKKMGKKGEGELKAWVQSKITKAADYIDTAADYVTNEESVNEEGLRDWFGKSRSSDGTPGWVQLGGKYSGKPCAKQPGQTTKPKCGSSKMKADLSDKEEEKAFRRKNQEDPNPDRKGKAKNVATEGLSDWRKELTEQLPIIPVTDPKRWPMRPGGSGRPYGGGSTPYEPEGELIEQQATYNQRIGRDSSVPSHLFGGDASVRGSLERRFRGLSIKDRRSFKGGGGYARMDKSGETMPQVIDRGRAEQKRLSSKMVNTANWTDERGNRVYAGSPPMRFNLQKNSYEPEGEMVEGAISGELDTSSRDPNKYKKGPQSPGSASAVMRNSYEPQGEVIGEEGKKDACYKKVKSRYKIWPSAYASGALVKCRKVGAANWGNKSEGFTPSQIKALEKIDAIEVNEEGQKCWKGYEKKGTKKMFGKTYNNCVKKEEFVDEGCGCEETCSKCGKNPCECNKKKKYYGGSPAKPGPDKNYVKPMGDVDESTIELTDAYGETFATIIDVVKPKPIETVESNIEYDTYDIDAVTEAVRIPAKTGNIIMVNLGWRGKYYSIKMFFPQISKPSRKDVQGQIEKVYPGGKLYSFVVTDYEPGQPMLHAESAAWTKKEGKAKSGGLNEKGRKSYEKENPGSDLKAPSKKVGNPRRASFCARMKGMKKKLTSKKTANDPDSRINKSLRAWNC